MEIERRKLKDIDMSNVFETPNKAKFTKLLERGVTDEFDQGVFKFVYRGYEVSVTTYENKPSVAVFPPNNSNPIFVYDGEVGIGIRDAIAYVERYTSSSVTAVPKPRHFVKSLRKITVSTTARVIAAALIAFMFAHVLTSYASFALLKDPKLVIFADESTGVNYVGTVFGPNAVRLNPDGTVFVTSKTE